MAHRCGSAVRRWWPGRPTVRATSAIRHRLATVVISPVRRAPRPGIRQATPQATRRGRARRRVPPTRRVSTPVMRRRPTVRRGPRAISLMVVGIRVRVMRRRPRRRSRLVSRVRLLMGGSRVRIRVCMPPRGIPRLRVRRLRVMGCRRRGRRAGIRVRRTGPGRVCRRLMVAGLMGVVRAHQVLVRRRLGCQVRRRRVVRRRPGVRWATGVGRRR